MGEIKRNRLTSDDSAINKVFSEGVLVCLHIRCWGATSRLAEEFYSEDMPTEICRAVYDLLPTKTFLEQLHGMRNEAKRYLYTHSMPFPIDGFVFVLKQDIEAVDAALVRRKEDFDQKVDQWLATYEHEVQDYAQKYPHLYKPEKYPTRAAMRGKFEFKWIFRRFDVVGTADVLPPEIYRQQVLAAQNEVRQMVDMAISAIGQQFMERIKSFQGQCVNGRINTTTLTNLKAFLDNFENKWDDYIGHEQLAAIVEECKGYLDGLDAEDLRYGTELRAVIADRMQGVIGQFNGVADVRLHRKLDI